MPGRVLFLIDSLAGRRGTELHLLELVRRLPALGIKPIVCNLGGDELVLRDIAALGVEAWAFPLRRAYSPAGWRAIRELTDRARANNVRLIQSYHFKSDLTGTIIAGRLSIPHISSRRDLGFQHTRSQRFVYRAINARVEAFVAPSTAVQRKLVEQDRVDPSRVQVIPNGVDVDRFTSVSDHQRQDIRASLGIDANEIVVGCVASLNPVKDHATLVGAFANAASRTRRARLLLVGTGQEEARLKTLAKTLGVLDRVTFAGERGDVHNVLHALDVFALASKSEGMPNALLEAMSSGVPVAATSAGGICDCVTNDVTGFLTPIGDQQALSKSLSQLIASSDLRHAMGIAGRRRAVEHFGLQRTVERSTALFSRLGVTPDESIAHVA